MRSDWVDPSTYEIRIAESKSRLISLSILYLPFDQQLFARYDGRGSQDPEACTIINLRVIGDSRRSRQTLAPRTY